MVEYYWRLAPFRRPPKLAFFFSGFAKPPFPLLDIEMNNFSSLKMDPSASCRKTPSRSTRTTPGRTRAPTDGFGWWAKNIFSSTDHKVIGIQLRSLRSRISCSPRLPFLCLMMVDALFQLAYPGAGAAGDRQIFLPHIFGARLDARTGK